MAKKMRFIVELDAHTTDVNVVKAELHNALHRSAMQQKEGAVVFSKSSIKPIKDGPILPPWINS